MIPTKETSDARKAGKQQSLTYRPERVKSSIPKFKGTL